MSAAVYLDNAATSWPKPRAVLDAMSHWYEELGVDASRGSSRLHEEVALRVRELRQGLAKLCSVSGSGVVLCPGATAAFNLYLKGFLGEGSRVLSTELEHNAAVRPLVGLRDRAGIHVDFLPPDSRGFVDPERVAEALEEGPSPELLVINHASNVTGAIQDLGSIVPLCKKRGTRVLVDCAQTAGRVDLTELGADAYVLPGHKGLMGPPGVGALCLDGAPELLALIEGGTGSSRATDRMPEELPASLEAGTPNTPGYYGWHAGLNWLQEQDPAKLHARELSLLGSLGERLAGLEEEGAVRCFGGTGERHVAILSLSFRDFDPVEVAVILEQHEIIARAGFHCAPYVHRALGTGESGTLRLSPGPFNTEEQIAAVGDVLLQVLKSGH